MPDFSKRLNSPEIMDDFSIGGILMDQTLKEIETINRLLGGNHVTTSGVSFLLKYLNHTGKPAEIADLGCGGGDMLAQIEKFTTKQSIRTKITGIDANPYIIDFCKKRYDNYKNLNFEALNVFSSEFEHRTYDVVTTTLFMHHFSDEKLVDLLKQLKRQVRIGIVINDLHRHWFAYYSIKLITAIFSRSHMVRYDAPISVLRAFKKKEWLNLLEKAGISNYSIKWKWAFRWKIVIECR